MNHGNTAGFPGSIKGLLEVSDHELRLRAVSTLGLLPAQEYTHKEGRDLDLTRVVI